MIFELIKRSDFFHDGSPLNLGGNPDREIYVFSGNSYNENSQILYGLSRQTSNTSIALPVPRANLKQIGRFARGGG